MRAMRVKDLKLEWEKPDMNEHVEFALAHPVYDPMTQILQAHFWRAAGLISAGLTVNIGME